MAMRGKPRFAVGYTLDDERRTTVSLTTDKAAIAETLAKIYPGRRITVVWVQWLDRFSSAPADAWREGGPVP
jgi:hypothetical protein